MGSLREAFEEYAADRLMPRRRMSDPMLGLDATDVAALGDPYVDNDTQTAWSAYEHATDRAAGICDRLEQEYDCDDGVELDEFLGRGADR